MSQILLKPLEAAISVFSQKSSSIKLYMTCWIHSHQIISRTKLGHSWCLAAPNYIRLQPQKSKVVDFHIYVNQITLGWRSHDLTSCQIYSNTFLQGNHLSNPQVPNSKLLAVSNEGEIILMAEIRVDPHNLHLRPHHPSPPCLDLKFIVSNPEKAPTFPLYLPRLCHFRYTWFHYIVISQAMQLQHFLGAKKGRQPNLPHLEAKWQVHNSQV